MISILDSFKEVISERFSLLKILVFVIPIYYSLTMLGTGTNGFSLFHTIFYTTAFFLIGFVVKTTNNVANERIVVVPQINPLHLAFSALKGIVAVGPVLISMILLASYVSSLINIMPAVDNILRIGLWIVALSIILTSYLLFCERESIIDSYRIGYLFSKAGDATVALITFVIQSIIFNIIVSGIIGYILFLLFGPANIFNFFTVLAIVFNLTISGHYFGKIYGEGLGYRSNID